MKDKRAFRTVLWISLWGLLLWGAAFAAVEKYDVIIKGGTIVDGTGKPGYVGDLAIRGERIVALGKITGEAPQRHRRQGPHRLPGFVDSHSHASGAILELPAAESYLMQGITMVLTGMCGSSPAPSRDMSFGEWMTKVENTPIGINLAMMVGFTSTIRELAVGEDFKRDATPEEIEKEKAYVEEAMQAGSFGMSTGQSPGLREYTSDEELIESAKVVQRYGGFWTDHTRWQEHDWIRDDPLDFGYGTNYAPPGEILAGRYHGLAECLELSRKANNCPQLISHVNPGYLFPEPHPEYLDEAAAQATIDQIIEPARKAGLKVYHNAIVASGYQNAGPGPGAQSTIIGTFQLGLFVKDYARQGGLKIQCHSGLAEKDDRRGIHRGPEDGRISEKTEGRHLYGEIQVQNGPSLAGPLLDGLLQDPDPQESGLRGEDDWRDRQGKKSGQHQKSRL